MYNTFIYIQHSSQLILNW